MHRAVTCPSLVLLKDLVNSNGRHLYEMIEPVPETCSDVELSDTSNHDHTRTRRKRKSEAHLGHIFDIRSIHDTHTALCKEVHQSSKRQYIETLLTFASCHSWDCVP